MQHRRIPLTAIDQRDASCAFRPSEPPAALAAAVRTHGILSPPCVVPTGGTFHVVYGFRRVEAARRAGAAEVPAVVCAENVPDCGLAGLISADNADHRMCAADTAGLAGVVMRLSGLDGRACDRAFGSVARGFCFADLMEIAALPAGLLAANRDGRISDDVPAVLAKLEPRVRPVLIGLVLEHGLQFSRGDLRRAGLLLKELGAVRGGDPGAALTDAAWRTVREPALTPKQRTERLLSLLQEQRYPRLEAFRAAMNAAVKRVTGDAPAGLGIQGHPYFERPDLRFSFSAADTAELDAQVVHLRRKLEDGSCTRLFRVAAGESADEG